MNALCSGELILRRLGYEKAETCKIVLCHQNIDYNDYVLSPKIDDTSAVTHWRSISSLSTHPKSP